MLAITSAVLVANAYYLHTIISMVAEAFAIDPGMIGIVPAFNQIALALGILFLLPLGDLVSNRALTLISVGCQTVCVAIMGLASHFTLFLGASTVLGFFTIAPYLLPAYASKRVPQDQLGYVTAVLTTGIIIGILVARAGAGIVAEQLGWRPVYYIASGLMLAVMLALPWVMASEPLRRQQDDPAQAGIMQTLQHYLHLLRSLFPIMRDNPEILISGALQGLGFGTFLVVWMGLGLHLPSPAMGYGVDVVGYLALLAIVSMVTTPRLGKWADRVGARRTRMILAAFQALATFMLMFVGHSVWWLLVPLILTNMFGPAIDVTGRMTFLSQAPEIRTRLMTVYIVLMFLGGGLGSWIGTASYDLGGWTGTALSASLMSLLMLGLSLYGYLRYRGRDTLNQT